MKKFLFGILAYIPVLFFALYTLSVIFLGLFVVFVPDVASSPLIFVFLIAYMFIILVLGVVTWFDIIYYMIVALKKPDHSVTEKVLWCLGFYFLNIFIFPFYFHFHLVKTLGTTA